MSENITVNITTVVQDYSVNVTSPQTQFSVDVSNGLIGAVLPIGGSTGQVLEKQSATNFDVVWANKSAIADGDKGDVVVSSSGATWTIDAGVVNTTKLGGDITTAGKQLLDDVDASAQRTTLGLGTAATENSTAFAAAVHSHNDLYFTEAEVTTFLAGKAEAAHTHAQSDVTGLVSALAAKADLVGGLVPTSQIPEIAITRLLGTVASQAAMLALSGQVGDWAIRSDTGASWIITGSDPTQITDWTSVSYPAAPVQSVNGQTGNPILGYADVGAAAASHTHAQSDITNLTTDLAGKQPLDADLTAIAALTGTNTIYYRSAADTWTAVTVGANLSFSGGTLNLQPTIALTSLRLNDTGADHYAQISSGENLSANRTLSVVLNDANRALTIADDATVSGVNNGIEYITITIENSAGSDITVGLKGTARIPFSGTIQFVDLTANATGSAVIDLWSASGLPTNTDTITGSSKPTLSAQQNVQHTTLTGWTTALVAGNQLAIEVESCSSISRLVITIAVAKT